MNTKFLSRIFFVIIVISNVACSVNRIEFYISPDGSDNNRGTKGNPFSTIVKAKQAVLNSAKKGKAKDYFIILANGLYEIEKPVTFKSEEFAGLNISVTVKADNHGSATISGGKRVTGWQKNSDGLWTADLKTEITLRELFIGGKRGIRARFPNSGYLRVKKVGDDRRTNFFFEEGEFLLPAKTNGVELVLFHDWSISRIGVKEIDEKQNKLTAVDSIGAKSPAFFNLDHWEKDPRYYLENALAFLDVEYEWYFDSDKGKIFLKLPETENPNDLQIYIPVAGSLVNLKGSEKNPVMNICFEGIIFKHCAWQIPEMGYCGVQACHFDARSESGWTEVPAAIKAEWAENCTFNNCKFGNLGTSGLWFSTGCSSCLVANSEFRDISGNGIMIGEGRNRIIDGEVWWKKAPEQVAANNTVENCSVSECGAQYFGAVGIWCGFTANTTIKNNEIYNLPYSGISIGWEWSPASTPCRENIIEGNHIHHIMKVLSDGGGIYMLGLQPGSKILGNHIHDVKINAGSAESNGMFLDEGTTDVVVANNLIYNIAKSPLRFHRATTNLVKENYLFCTGENPPIRYNRTNEEDIKKVDNKVYSEGDEDYLEKLEEKKGKF
ncbi:MAG: right-handed parallel beta-helix repeat-containing protein [Bacteroidota bacterium]